MTSCALSRLDLGIEPHGPRSCNTPVHHITTRIRSNFAAALKRASLERQLHGTEPNTQQESLEEAIELRLNQHAYSR